MSIEKLYPLFRSDVRNSFIDRDREQLQVRGLALLFMDTEWEKDPDVSLLGDNLKTARSGFGVLRENGDRSMEPVLVYDPDKVDVINEKVVSMRSRKKRKEELKNMGFTTFVSQRDRIIASKYKNPQNN